MDDFKYLIENIANRITMWNYYDSFKEDERIPYNDTYISFGGGHISLEEWNHVYFYYRGIYFMVDTINGVLGFFPKERLHDYLTGDLDEFWVADKEWNEPFRLNEEDVKRVLPECKIIPNKLLIQMAEKLR